MTRQDSRFVFDVGLLLIIGAMIGGLFVHAYYPQLMLNMVSRLAWGIDWIIYLVIFAGGSQVVLLLLTGVERIKSYRLDNEHRRAEIGLLQARAFREQVVTLTAKPGEGVFSNLPLTEFAPAAIPLKVGQGLWTHARLNGGEYFEGQQPYNQLLTADQQPDSLVPPVRHGEWWVEIIEKLKAEFDDYNQPLTMRISGNPGTGKTTLAMELLAELIKPFDSADIVILDRKAGTSPGKWGDMQVLAENIESYPAAMQLIMDEFNKRTGESDPLFPIIDEIDEAHLHHGADFDRLLKSMLSVGRELAVNPFVIGQSPLSKTCGLDTVTKRFFQLWAILGVDGIEQYLTSAECGWERKVKDAYKLQLRDVENNRFIGLAIPPRLISKPFLFVLPALSVPKLGQTKERSIFDYPYLPDKPEPTDFDVIAANEELLRYNNDGTVIISSICDVLSLSTGGAGYRRGKELAEEWNAIRLSRNGNGTN